MFAVDVVEGLAFLGQRVTSKKHKDYHVFFKEKIQVSWIFTCSLLEVGKNLQVTTSLNCPLIFSSEFFGFPLRSKKKNLVGASIPRGENPRFSPPEMREATLRCTFCNSQFQARRRRFTSRGVMENQKKTCEEIFCLVLNLFLGGLIVLFSCWCWGFFYNPRPSWEKYMDDPDGNLYEHVWSN